MSREEIIDAMTCLIGGVSTITKSETTYVSFPEVANHFVRYLRNVEDTLLEIKVQFESLATLSTASRLQRPLSLIEEATENGKIVLNVFQNQRNRLVAHAFSETYFGKLATAKDNIRVALRLLLTTLSSLGLPSSEQVQQQMEMANTQGGAIAELLLNQSHDVAKWMEDIVQTSKPKDELPQPIVDYLVQLHIVDDMLDCKKQLYEIQTRHCEFVRHAKVSNEELILDWIVQLPLQDNMGDVKTITVNQQVNQTESDALDGDRIPNAEREDDKKEEVGELMLQCPISLQLVRDPVLLIVPENQPPHLYDKKSLCTSLLHYPTKEPTTGRTYDTPLRYVDSIHHRQILIAKYGETAYVKYDDTDFQRDYEQVFRGRRSRRAQAGGVLPQTRRERSEPTAQSTAETLTPPPAAILAAVPVHATVPAQVAPAPVHATIVQRPRDCEEVNGKVHIYGEIQAYLFGMGTHTIDYQKAYKLSEGELGSNPILDGYQALIEDRKMELFGMKRNGMKCQRCWDRCREGLKRIILPQFDSFYSANAKVHGIFLYACYDLFMNNIQGAVQNFQVGAELGHAPSQCYLGMMYSRIMTRLAMNTNRLELYVKKDYAKAARYLTQAAAQGHAMAQCCLGNMHRDRIGVSRDMKKAMEFYQKAANQGYRFAGTHLVGTYKYARTPRPSVAAESRSTATEAHSSETTPRSTRNHARSKRRVKASCIIS